MSPGIQVAVGLLAPLFDARLLLAVLVVGCATAALLQAVLSAEGWGAAVAGAMWWTQRTADAREKDSRGL